MLTSSPGVAHNQTECGDAGLQRGVCIESMNQTEQSVATSPSEAADSEMRFSRCAPPSGALLREASVGANSATLGTCSLVLTNR